MNPNRLAFLGLAALSATSVLAPAAIADGRNPGSLLVYPEYDNRGAIINVVTVTNTNPGGGDIDVEFRYIDRIRRVPDGQGGFVDIDQDCEKADFTVRLTPNDTFTAITNIQNPDPEQGYMYLFAKDTATGEAVTYNYLIGNSLTLNGANAFEYSVNPWAFSGVTASGTPTDLEAPVGDGIRDLNGCEYEMSPDMILVPRFFGQGAPFGFASQLVIIALTGGTEFNTTVDFLIYNDNEEVFSKDYTFFCWDKSPVLAISGAFDRDFLRNFTNHDLNEVFGAPTVESGWFSMDGAVASSTEVSIDDPAILGLLIERITAANYAGADLAFETGTQDNGDLLPRELNGDTNDVVCNP